MRAVAAAETRTGAEVVLMVVRRATDTRTAEMTAAAILALAVPAALLPFAQRAPRSSSGSLSSSPSWLAAVLLPATGARASAAQPRNSRSVDAVRAAAEAQFFSHGLRNTDERAAVLIFVSMAEREAHVLFDDAAGAKVGPAQWRGVAGDLARGIKRRGRRQPRSRRRPPTRVTSSPRTSPGVRTTRTSCRTWCCLARRARPRTPAAHAR